MPFESSSHAVRSVPRRPTRSRRSGTRAAAVSRLTPFELRQIGEKRADAHLAVHAALLRQVADAILGLERRRRAQHRQRPESGNRIDMIMRMQVVLPAPLGPITP
jgi:hypothetical protein